MQNNKKYNISTKIGHTVVKRRFSKILICVKYLTTINISFNMKIILTLKSPYEFCFSIIKLVIPIFWVVNQGSINNVK